MASKEIPGIVGLGGVEGSRVITNDHIATLLKRPSKAVKKLMQNVGIESRNWTEDEYATSDLAVEAVNRALKMANIRPEDVKAIWCGTMTEDYPGVPIAPSVKERVGTPRMGVYFDISTACVGFLSSLYIAYNNISSPYGLGGPQVVVGSDTLSKFLSPNKRETFMVFGDAAGAVIIDRVVDENSLSAKIAFQFGADGSHVEDLYIPAGGSRIPTSEETVRNNQHCIWMNGKLVKEYAQNDMRECIMRAVAKADVTFGDIMWLFPHQANLEIIDGLAKDIGFPRERVYKNIKHKGNTSSASIPLALSDAYHEGKLLPDELIISCSFGAGSEFGAAVLPTVGVPRRTTAERIRDLIPT